MSAARNPWYKIQGMPAFLHRCSISTPAAASAGGLSQSDHAKLQGYNRSGFFSSCYYYLGSGDRNNFMNQGLNLRSVKTVSTKPADHQEEKSQPHVARDEDKKTQPITLPVAEKQQGFASWSTVKWLLGSFLSLLLPFFKQKWERFRGLEGKVEKVVEEVEVVAEMVENVATVAEKVSSEVAAKLPDNNKMKQAVLAVEHLSSVAAQEAQLAQDFIHKVGEVKQDLKEMETVAQPVMDKIAEPHQQNVP